MKVAFEASFERDLRRVHDKQLLQRMKQVIEVMKAAPDLSTLPDLRKMQGYDTFYRIRLGITG